LNTGYINKKAKNFENIQPNFVFRLDIDLAEDKEENKKLVYNNFSNKTRYNIKVAHDRGLTVEVYDKDNVTEEILDRFSELMNITGKRDNFMVRPKQYFKNMVERIYPYCRLYMVKYSYEADFNRVNEKLQAQLKNREKFLKKKQEVAEQIDAGAEGDKLEKLNKKLESAETNIQEAERQIASFEERIKSIEEFKGREDIYVSGAVYIYYGGKGWYFYGASHNILRDTMPNFLMQWSMISDSIDLGCSMYDFRGVSGDLNPENPLYGLYKFKKGFNGKFVEFIGEYELVIDNFVYSMFKVALPKFKAIRRKLRKR
jgi:peptidoglycan pentaglycine glycine transferase (the first glycine)